MQIDKNIQIPTDRKQRSKNFGIHYAEYVRAMSDVGDSCVFPYEDEDQAMRVRSGLCVSAKYHGKKITTRKCVENGEKVIRAWRIE